MGMREASGIYDLARLARRSIDEVGDAFEAFMQEFQCHDTAAA